MKRKILIAFAGLVLAFAMATPGAATPDPRKAESFVRVGLNQAFEVLRDGTLSDRQKSGKLRVLVRDLFDVDTIGKFALGAYRRGVDKARMRAYLDAFEIYLVDAYVNRIVGYTPEAEAGSGDILTVSGTRPAGKTDLFVLSELKRKGVDPEPIEWRLRDRGGRLAIIDVSIRGTSQALAYKQEFASVIRRRGAGIDGLIAELKEKHTRATAGTTSEAPKIN